MYQRMAREPKHSIDKLIDQCNQHFNLWTVPHTSNKYSQWILPRVCKNKDSWITSWHKITTISSTKTKMFSFPKTSIPSINLRKESSNMLRRTQWPYNHLLTFLPQLNINLHNMYLYKDKTYFQILSLINRTDPLTMIKVKISSIKSLTQLSLTIQWVLFHKWCPHLLWLTIRFPRFLI